MKKIKRHSRDRLCLVSRKATRLLNAGIFSLGCSSESEYPLERSNVPSAVASYRTISRRGATRCALSFSLVTYAALSIVSIADYSGVFTYLEQYPDPVSPTLAASCRVAATSEVPVTSGDIASQFRESRRACDRIARAALGRFGAKRNENWVTFIIKHEKLRQCSYNVRSRAGSALTRCERSAASRVTCLFLTREDLRDSGRPSGQLEHVPPSR